MNRTPDEIIERIISIIAAKTRSGNNKIECNGILWALLEIDKNSNAHPLSATNILQDRFSIDRDTLDVIQERLYENFIANQNIDIPVQLLFDTIKQLYLSDANTVRHNSLLYSFISQTGFLFANVLNFEKQFVINHLDIDSPYEPAYIIIENEGIDTNEFGNEFRDIQNVLANQGISSPIDGLQELLEVMGLIPPRQHSPQRNQRQAQESESRTRRSRRVTKQLEKFGVDLVKLAREGKLDPLIGREKELRRLYHILLRKRKNNPILVGEAGTGKTAIVEGFAQLIAEGKVNEQFKNKQIINLNMGSLVAGTRFRGDFEERLEAIIKLAQKDPNIILFIDEFHTLIGTGASSGENALDAANILKPALARGEIQIIGATTTDEYKNYIEKDRAFERRLVPIFVKENTPEETEEILNALIPIYSEFHKVKYEDGIASKIVGLADRYISYRHFPDKAIDILDEAGAAARLNNNDIVNESLIKETVSIISGVPITQLTADDKDKLNNIEAYLKSKVIGQDEAVEALATAVRRGRIRIGRRDKPIGVFLFLGPTGTGKTEIAKRLTEYLFGDQKYLLRLDMSEFMHSHEVAKITGAPPGYVGYYDNSFVEFVRRNPYSVILIDEIEKAHPRVLDIFLQIMDDGQIKDGQGRIISFKDTILIMTSNIGTSNLIHTKKSIGFIPEIHENCEKISVKQQLEKQLRPEFINRIDKIIVFNKLTKDTMYNIARVHVNELIENIEKQKIKVKYTDKVLHYLAEHGYDARYGARPLKRLIQDKIENVIVDAIAANELKPGDTIKFDVDKNGNIKFKVIKPKIKLL